MSISITIEGDADLAWIFAKDTKPIGVNLRKKQSVMVQIHKYYSIATFKLVTTVKKGSHFASSGQVYIYTEGDDVQRQVPLYILKQESSMWYKGVRTKCPMSVAGKGILDVTEKYEKASKDIIDASMEHVLATSISNQTLVRLYRNPSNHYTDLGFSRFAQRRDTHHAIMTPGSAGLPELSEFRISADCWDNCCLVASRMAGYNASIKLTAEQSLNVLDNLTCGALAVIGFMFQWNKEPFDSLCIPATVLGTMQDCEDNAAVVVATFNYLKRHAIQPKTALGRKLLKHLYIMADTMWTGAGYVDTTVADPSVISKDTITGHVFGVMVLKKDYRRDQRRRIYIVECTNFFYVNVDVDNVDGKPGDVQQLFGGALRQSSSPFPDNITYKPPVLQPFARYRTIDVLFSAKDTYLIGRAQKGAKFIVGMKPDEFVLNAFDRHATATPEIRKRVHELWDGFYLAPNVWELEPLVMSYTELAPYRKPHPKVSSLDNIKESMPMAAYSAYDTNVVAIAPLKGIECRFPFTTLVLVYPDEGYFVRRD